MNVLTEADVSVEWFSQCLEDAGHSAQVSGYSGQDIGTGQTGRCVQYSLQFSGDPGDAPTSLVAKFSSADPTSKSTGQAMKTYRTEVDFYTKIQPKVSIRVPRCYYANVDEENLEHTLLMQDMSPAQQGDQIAGCSIEVARQAVLELVGLQAPSWRDNSWYDLLGRVEDGPFADMKTLYNNTMPGFVERYADVMDPAHIRFIQAIGEANNCPMFDYRCEHFSLEHYDYRLDNVLIDEQDEVPTVTTVDWQSIRVGKPLNDVAYFMGSALSLGERREAEQEILRDYHDALLAAGVEDFSFEECFKQYRRSVYAGFAISVVAPVLVVRTERGDKMFTTMATRYAQMAQDLGSDEFLE